MTMKRIIWKFAFFLPVLILFLSVNYWVDPANRFSGGKYERGLAELVLAGKHAANVTDYDERVFEKFYIAGTTHKKDLIVLGSSRTLPIGAASGLFRDKNYFNNSVSGASLEDLMAIYSLWRQKGLLPSAIVLGLDPSYGGLHRLFIPGAAGGPFRRITTPSRKYYGRVRSNPPVVRASLATSC